MRDPSAGTFDTSYRAIARVTSAVLKTFVVDTRDRQVDIRFSGPPETLEEIFAAMFRF